MKKIILLVLVGLSTFAVSANAQLFGLSVGRHGVSVGVGLPGFCAPPAVAYSAPAPVYYGAPAYYVAPPAYYAPPPVVYSSPGYAYGPTVVIGGYGGWHGGYRYYGRGHYGGGVWRR